MLRFSPDGGVIASEGSSTIRLWDAQTGEHLKTLFESGSFAFSPDGRTIAIGGGWDGVIHLRNVDTGERRRTLIGHTAWVGSVVFSPDGRTIASGSEDDTIRLWDTDTGNHQRTLTAPGAVNSVAFSPNGRTIASGTAETT